MTDKDRGDLLHAIQDTINPQGTLCSWGACRAGDECVKGEAELMSHSHYMRIDAPTAEIGRPV